MNTEPYPERKKRLTLLSKIALAWGIVVLTFSVLASWILYMNWDITLSIAQGPYPRLYSFGKHLGIIGFFGGFIGLIAIFVLLIYYMIKRIRGLNAYLVCVSFIMSFFAFFSTFVTHARMCNSTDIIYPIHLQILGHVIRQYKEGQVHQLPEANNWCDALIKFNSSLSPNDFVNDRTSNVFEGMSDYAFNANLSELKLEELPKDTVLLFETPLGKNPAGGPELMSMDNHPIKGCFVLFADMHIEFVRAEDFNDLRWKP